MKKFLKTGCWTAVIATGFLSLGATAAQAQFRAATGNQQAARTVNANSYRSNFTRPVRQPMQTLNSMNRGTANQFQGGNQQGVNPYGMNPYGANPYGMNPYGMNPYGANPYGMNPYGMNPYGMMNQGGFYPGMTYPGYYGY